MTTMAWCRPESPASLRVYSRSCRTRKLAPALLQEGGDVGRPRTLKTAERAPQVQQTHSMSCIFGG
jgi:hypothetical protein